MRQHSEEETKKKMTIALKSIVQEEEELDQSENDDEDEELALITRKFKRFMKKRRQGVRRRPSTKGEPSKEKDKELPLICYKCKKPVHFRFEYPQLKKAPKKFKKKAIVAT